MSDNLPDALVAQFSEFVAAHIGLHFPPDRWADLRRGIRAVARDLGYDDDAACARAVMSQAPTRQHMDVLAGNLTVGETYFFREHGAFEALEHRVLPELVAARRGGARRLRMWSAGCCTGEEAYSLAILLCRAIPDLRDWNVTVLATDVNPRFLQKAARGVFGDWSFRDAPGWLKGNYFTTDAAGHRAIRPDVHRMVTFAHLNLARDAYPSLLNDTNAMDVILCRNTLMYFTPEQAARVTENMIHCLLDGGWLVLSATELPPRTPVLSAVQFDRVTFYRKSGAQFAAAPQAPAAPVAPEAPPPAVARSGGRAAALDPFREAGALYARGDYPAASAALTEAARGRRLDSGAMLLLARSLANQGRLAEALHWCDRAVAGAKLSPVGHHLRASILHEQGAMAEAEQAWHRALYLDQTFVLAHFALGNLARARGARAEAARHFANALRLLRDHGRDEILPESDGLTAGRLSEVIAATMAEESAA